MSPTQRYFVARACLLPMEKSAINWVAPVEAVAKAVEAGGNALARGAWGATKLTGKGLWGGAKLGWKGVGPAWGGVKTVGKELTPRFLQESGNGIPMTPGRALAGPLRHPVFTGGVGLAGYGAYQSQAQQEAQERLANFPYLPNQFTELAPNSYYYQSSPSAFS